MRSGSLRHRGAERLWIGSEQDPDAEHRERPVRQGRRRQGGRLTNFGGSARLVIRGENSISGNNQPLWVVDGIPVDNSNLTERHAGARLRRSRLRQRDLGSESLKTSRTSGAEGSGGGCALRFARCERRDRHHHPLGQERAAAAFRRPPARTSRSTTYQKLPDYQDQYGQGSNGQFEFVDGLGGGTRTASTRAGVRSSTPA